jgi:hypothetical protein
MHQVTQIKQPFAHLRPEPSPRADKHGADGRVGQPVRVGSKAGEQSEKHRATSPLLTQRAVWGLQARPKDDRCFSFC